MTFPFRSLLPGFLLALLFIGACGEERKPFSDPEPPASSSTPLPSGTPPADTAPGGDTGGGLNPDSAVTITPGGLPDSARKYEIRSAVVEYWNSWLNRRQTLYVDDYGSREAYYTAPDIGGGGGANLPYDVSIYADGWRYDYSTETRSGTKAKKEIVSGPILGVVQDVWALPEAAQEQFGLRNLGKKKIAGKDVIGYSFEFNGRTTVWLWKGIPLSVKIERPVQGGGEAEILFEANRVQADVPVPAEKFQVPPDITLK